MRLRVLRIDSTRLLARAAGAAQVCHYPLQGDADCAHMCACQGSPGSQVLRVAMQAVVLAPGKHVASYAGTSIHSLTYNYVRVAPHLPRLSEPVPEQSHWTHRVAALCAPSAEHGRQGRAAD
jgi:hypothetical protein